MFPLQSLASAAIVAVLVWPANGLPRPFRDSTTRQPALDSTALLGESKSADTPVVLTQRQFFGHNGGFGFQQGSPPGNTGVQSSASSSVASASQQEEPTTIHPVPTSSMTTIVVTSTMKADSAASTTTSPTRTTTKSQTSVSSSLPTGISSFTTHAMAANPTMIRGVNIGGWLILEKWMTSDVFEGTNAVDQYTFDQTPGAQAKLEAHWSTYFTQADVQKIASWGINALRIPIGYWAYTDAAPYLSGADAYLEQAIEWARAAGLKVLVDCHGSPGSQNGFDNSGHAGSVNWQTEDNLAQSISVLETMAAKYGSKAYADVVFAIELVNEPISWGANNLGTTQSWSQQAYAAVKAKATNPDLIVVMHDGFEGPSAWTEVGASVNGANTPLNQAKFAIDTHLYQNQVASDSLLNQAGHIAKACSWTSTKLLPSSSKLPVYVGEFSLATNICANPDGTTLAGSVCTQSGCQCSSNVPVQYWNAPLIAATRKFLEAEMDAFEHSSNGWFLWSYKGPGGWGLTNAIEYGLIGSKVTDRMYPNQCGSTW